jgi:phosphatidylethanolamine/phosphatidyl-N-methylethanolamine N-methyltransferase
MSELNIEKADFIVSSLPLAILPKTLRKRIVIEANNRLNIDGEFIQFQYTLQSLKLFKKVFKKVSVRHCLFNIPPAFVYSCKKQ